MAGLTGACTVCGFAVRLVPVDDRIRTWPPAMIGKHRAWCWATDKMSAWCDNPRYDYLHHVRLSDVPVGTLLAYLEA